MNERIALHLVRVSMLSRVLQDEPRTPQESHSVVSTRETVPSDGQLDVSEKLANGQSDDVLVVAVLWCDGECVRDHLVVEIGRASKYIGVVIEKRANLRGGT